MRMLAAAALVLVFATGCSEDVTDQIREHIHEDGTRHSHEQREDFPLCVEGEPIPETGCEVVE